jgi:lipopolysaccharide biosynthesis regulator YciM
MPERHVCLGEKATRKKLAAQKSIGICPVRGLVRYASRSAAKQAVKSIISKGKGNIIQSQGRELHEYRCQKCGNWHVGH